MSARTRNVAFMACPEEDFGLFMEALARLDGDGGWTLVCFYPPPVPVPAHVEVIVSSRAVRTAARLWGRCAVRRVDRLVVCCHDLDVRSGVQPLIDFISLCPASERTLLDLRGRRETVAPAGPATIAGYAAVPLLLLASMIVTRIGLALYRRGAPATILDPSRGRTAILMPVLPDLSHTFVYREVLSVIQRHPEYLVLALERSDSAVVHGEAAALLPKTTFVPRLSPARYLLMYLALWFRRPAQIAALIRFFQPHTAEFGSGARRDDELCFLRLEFLHHTNYLIVGLMLAEFLRRKHITCLHVYGSTSPSLRALVAHRMYGVPYSVSTYADFEYPTPFHMLDAKLRHARFIVACSEFCRGRLIERVPDAAGKVHVLRPSVPQEYGANPALRPADGHSRIVYVGRFVPKKGLDTLLRACAVLRDSGVETACHLYGGGPEEPHLRRLAVELGIQDRVFLHPGVPNQHLYTTMNRDDVFVCASRYMPDGERDGLPVTLVEVMAAGVTVVATPVAGITELVEHGRNGYLVPPDDPASLGSLLIGLITDPGRRQAIQAEARRTVRERFALEDAGDRLGGWIERQKSP